MIGRLRSARYDRVYDLQTSSKSSLYFQLLRPFAPAWSGIALGCSLPHRNRRRNHMHTLERQADQLREAGVWPDAPTEPGTAPPPDLSWLLAEPETDQPVRSGRQALCAAGARRFGAPVPRNAGRPSKFAELAVRLRARGSISW